MFSCNDVYVATCIYMVISRCPFNLKRTSVILHTHFIVVVVTTWTIGVPLTESCNAKLFSNFNNL